MALGNNLVTWLGASALAAMITAMVGMTLDRNELRTKLAAAEAKVAELNITVASRDAAIATLNDTKVDGEEIARVTAKACAAAAKFQIRASSEAQEIHNASDDAAAARAYDRLLCSRPEAAGHPACTAAAEARE